MWNVNRSELFTVYSVVVRSVFFSLGDTSVKTRPSFTKAYSTAPVRVLFLRKLLFIVVVAKFPGCVTWLLRLALSLKASSLLSTQRNAGKL